MNAPEPARAAAGVLGHPVDTPLRRVVGYRFRTTFARRWRGYLAVVLLVGSVGGLAMGALAGARRTQSSFPAFLASTNPSDLAGPTAVINPAIGGIVGYDPVLLARIAHLPHVAQVESYSGLNILPLAPNGAPADPAMAAAGDGSGSVDGLYFDQDRVTVVKGRMADPTRADEFVTDASDAQILGLHVGQVVPMGVYTNAQTNLPDFGTARVQPYRRLNATLTGIVVLNNTLVEDDVDATASLTSGLFTPALTRPLLGCCTNYTTTGVKVDRHRDLGTVRAEIGRLLPTGFPPFQDTSFVRAQADRAIKPEAVALGVFGAIAGLAALVIASQVIGRQIRLGADERGVLRAMGASPAMTAGDGVVGVLGAVLLGSLLAVAVAVLLSPLAPIGPVRRVKPQPGIALDWTVLGAGFAVLVAALGAVALALAYANAPHRGAERSGPGATRPSTLAATASSSGLPVSAVVGIGFALQPGGGRRAAPVRSAILGAALAVIVVVATLTFGASLHSLVSHPSLYGWNWDYALTAGDGIGDIPQQPVTQLLDHDPDIAAWTGAYFSTLQLDGQTVPVLGTDPNAAVAPPILSGRALGAPDEVVLGAITLSQLHKKVGDTVSVSGGTGPSTTVTIVGTAAMPAIGVAGLAHLEMGTGAVLSYQLIPVAHRNLFADPLTGPNTIFVRLRGGIDRPKALVSLQAIGQKVSNTANFGVFPDPVQRPAEIVNYRSMGSTPALLGAALAAGAVIALGLTLLASVRRRRRDLALLKTLGFSRRQLASAVAWQSTVAVVIGTVVGIPVGIALGRQLWILFARQIHAVPSPSVSTPTIVLVAIGGVVLANIVAAVPGRLAARTPTALVLRAE